MQALDRCLAEATTDENALTTALALLPTIVAALDAQQYNEVLTKIAAIDDAGTVAALTTPCISQAAPDQLEKAHDALATCAQKCLAVDDAAGRYALSLDAIGAPAGSKIAYVPSANEKEALAKLLGVEKTAAEVEREHVFAIENASLFPHRYARVIALQRFDGLEWLRVDRSQPENLNLLCPSMSDMLKDLQTHANDVPDTIAEALTHHVGKLNERVHGRSLDPAALILKRLR